MKKVPVYKKGEVVAQALVDDEDYELVMSRGRWNLSDNGYARRQEYIRGSGRNNQRSIIVRMHRLVLGLSSEDNVDVDHINGDRLDNRKANLRVCSRSENLGNQRPRQGGTSRFKGVVWSTRERKWRSTIQYQGRQKHIGYFDNEEDAARAYDRKALELFGEFARLNFPEEVGSSSVVVRKEVIRSYGYGYS